MRNTLKLLYDKFYTPVPMAEAEHEIEVCHRQLIERLEMNTPPPDGHLNRPSQTP